MDELTIELYFPDNISDDEISDYFSELKNLEKHYIFIERFQSERKDGDSNTRPSEMGFELLHGILIGLGTLGIRKAKNDVLSLLKLLNERTKDRYHVELILKDPDIKYKGDIRNLQKVDDYLQQRKLASDE